MGLEETAPQGKSVPQSAPLVTAPKAGEESNAYQTLATVDLPASTGAASSERSGILGAACDSSADSQARPPSSQLGVFPVTHWDRYEFVSLLGRGGMGSVYKAMDKRIGRMVALKFVRGDDERLIRRFLQEARAQARIEHPGICKVLEVGEVEEKPYIAMQFVDGQSLQQAKPHLSQDEKVLIIKESASALHAAHQVGILHRDCTESKTVGVTQGWNGRGNRVERGNPVGLGPVGGRRGSLEIKRHHPDPFYWAPFLAVGRDEPLRLSP